MKIHNKVLQLSGTCKVPTETQTGFCTSKHVYICEVVHVGVGLCGDWLSAWNRPELPSKEMQFFLSFRLCSASQLLSLLLLLNVPLLSSDWKGGAINTITASEMLYAYVIFF